MPGVKEALQKTRAQLLYVINIMTKFGETHQFSGRDFVAKLEASIERKVDGIVYNTVKPSEDLLARYRDQRSQFVEIDNSDGWWQDRRLYAADLLETSGGIVRHHSGKLAEIIRSIVSQHSA